jgi:hypothetical protein
MAIRGNGTTDDNAYHLPVGHKTAAAIREETQSLRLKSLETPYP